MAIEKLLEVFEEAEYYKQDSLMDTDSDDDGSIGNGSNHGGSNHEGGGLGIDLTGILFGNIDSEGKLMDDDHFDPEMKEHLGSLAK